MNSTTITDHSWEHFLRTLSALLFMSNLEDALEGLHSDGCKKIQNKALDMKILISKPGWQSDVTSLKQANIPHHLIQYISKNPQEINCHAYVECLLDVHISEYNNKTPE
jgi:hypothetical protein